MKRNKGKKCVVEQEDGGTRTRNKDKDKETRQTTNVQVHDSEVDQNSRNPKKESERYSRPCDTHHIDTAGHDDGTRHRWQTGVRVGFRVRECGWKGERLRRVGYEPRPTKGASRCPIQNIPCSWDDILDQLRH